MFILRQYGVTLKIQVYIYIKVRWDFWLIHRETSYVEIWWIHKYECLGEFPCFIHYCVKWEMDDL